MCKSLQHFCHFYLTQFYTVLYSEPCLLSGSLMFMPDSNPGALSALWWKFALVDGGGPWGFGEAHEHFSLEYLGGGLFVWNIPLPIPPSPPPPHPPPATWLICIPTNSILSRREMCKSRVTAFVETILVKTKNLLRKQQIVLLFGERKTKKEVWPYPSASFPHNPMTCCHAQRTSVSVLSGPAQRYPDMI